MTHPFQQMCEVPSFRNGMMASLSMRPEASVSDMASALCVGWPLLAEMWPVQADGREVVDICRLADKTRSFRGIEMPPFIGASRFVLLCMGAEAVHISKSMSPAGKQSLQVNIDGVSLDDFDARMSAPFDGHWPGFVAVVDGAILAGATNFISITTDWHLSSGKFFTSIVGPAGAGRAYVSSSGEGSHTEWLTKKLGVVNV